MVSITKIFTGYEMINLRWKTNKETGEKVLQWSNAFNIQMFANGPMRGCCVLIPPPPGTKLMWVDVPVEEVDFSDKNVDVKQIIPEANKVLAPQHARQPIERPEER